MKAAFVLLVFSLLLIPSLHAQNLPGNGGDQNVQGTEASIAIDVEYFANYNPPNATEFADMSGNIFVADEEDWRGAGFAIIELTENGEPIVDDITLEDRDVHGLHIARGEDEVGGYVEITSYGFNHRESRESVIYEIELLNADITGILNDARTGIGKYEKPNRNGCGIDENFQRNAINDRPANDEFDVEIRGRIGSFCSTTSDKLDGVRIYYLPN